MGVWLVVMALCFALALGLWITLVFRAERHTPEMLHDSLPHREVIGGKFDAHEGGRQVMPDPREPLIPESDRDQAGPRHPASEQSTEHEPPDWGQTGMPEQAPARGDRP
jgi:hypothetical protein